MADPEFYRKAGESISRARARTDELGKELEGAYGRWEELEGIKEANSKPGKITPALESCPELTTICLPGVIQLMEDGVVHQLVRQSKQVDVQVDVAFLRAAAPSGFLVFHQDPVLSETVLTQQLVEPSG